MEIRLQRERYQVSENIMVVGLGLMGTALAKTLLNSDFNVTVWNRTAAKAEALIREGASKVDSVAEGAKTNDIIILCLATYDNCYEVLGDCNELKGKTIIQLTTASVEQAQLMAEWATAKQVDYLDGAIIAYPSGVGSAGCMFIIAGEEAAWARSEPIIRTLAPASRFMGRDVSVPASLDFALIFSSVASELAVIQGYHLLEDSEISAETYAAFVTPLFSPGIAAGIRKKLLNIEQNDFGHADATINTWRTAIAHAGDAGKKPKNTEFIASVKDILDSAIASGEGDKDISAVIRYMRQTT